MAAPPFSFANHHKSGSNSEVFSRDTEDLRVRSQWIRAPNEVACGSCNDTMVDEVMLLDRCGTRHCADQ